MAADAWCRCGTGKPDSARRIPSGTAIVIAATPRTLSNLRVDEQDRLMSGAVYRLHQAGDRNEKGAGQGPTPFP
jgi:hypothetical protein